MGKEFSFDKSICGKSSFQYKKIDKTDLNLIKNYNIIQWNNEEFNEESLLKRGIFIVNEERNIILKALGGGAFEIPEMYTFIYGGEKIHIECGGGGKPANIFKHNNDGSYTQDIMISHVRIPLNLYLYVDDISLKIAEALAIYSFNSPGNLYRVKVIFFFYS